MKKIITTILVGVLLAPSFAFSSFKAATLYKDSDRVAVYSKEEADGLFAKGYKLEQTLGYYVISDYKTSLTSSISATQTSIPVSSMSTKDGHTIEMADIGSYAYLTIEPGGSKAEIVACSGISGKTWTGCIRGLAFYGTSEVSVPANQKTHNSGSQIVMSNTHYVYQRFVDTDSNQTIAGNKTFSSLPKTSSYITPTLDEEFAGKKYVDDVALSGVPNATETTKGVSELATRGEAVIGSSTGLTGARLVLPGSIASSSADVATSSVVVTQNTGRINPNFYQGNNNIWSASSTFASTTNFSSVATFASSTLTINGTSLDPLVSATSTRLHNHFPLMGTYATSSISNGTVQTVSHSLGINPKKITIKAITTTHYSTHSFAFSDGVWTPLGTTSYGVDNTGNPSWGGFVSTSIISIDESSAANGLSAVISSVSTSSFSLTWSVTTSVPLSFVWSVE